MSTEPRTEAKTAAEYAILALLFWWALRKPVRNDPRPWKWREAALPVLFVGLYAASDEIHQLFVPNREGKFADVIIDTAGALLGIFLVWFIGRVSRKFVKTDTT